MRKSVLGGLLIAGLAIVVAGCGGSASDEDLVKDHIKYQNEMAAEWTKATDKDNYKKAEEAVKPIETKDKDVVTKINALPEAKRKEVKDKHKTAWEEAEKKK